MYFEMKFMIFDDRKDSIIIVNNAKKMSTNLV